MGVNACYCRCVWVQPASAQDKYPGKACMQVLRRCFSEGQHTPEDELKALEPDKKKRKQVRYKPTPWE